MVRIYDFLILIDGRKKRRKYEGWEQKIRSLSLLFLLFLFGRRYLEEESQVEENDDERVKSVKC